MYILTSKSDQVQAALRKRLRREPGIPFAAADTTQPANADRWIQQIPGTLYYEIHVLEMIWLKSIVRHIDPHAGIVTHPEK
ncbi:hypothetical protein BZG17_27975 [Escherichia coli]|nr:hypothetical protein [Escherichia coli]